MVDTAVGPTKKALRKVRRAFHQVPRVGDSAGRSKADQSASIFEAFTTCAQLARSAFTRSASGWGPW